MNSTGYMDSSTFQSPLTLLYEIAQNSLKNLFFMLYLLL